MVISESTKNSVWKRRKHSFPHKVTLTLSDKLYRKIKKMAISERRTIPQQTCYLMEIGLDLIDQQLSVQLQESEGPEQEELSPAIGFRVDREDD